MRQIYRSTTFRHKQDPHNRICLFLMRMRLIHQRAGHLNSFIPASNFSGAFHGVVAAEPCAAGKTAMPGLPSLAIACAKLGCVRTGTLHFAYLGKVFPAPDRRHSCLADWAGLEDYLGQWLRKHSIARCAARRLPRMRRDANIAGRGWPRWLDRKSVV